MPSVAAALAPTLVTVAATGLAGSGAPLHLSPELRPVEALYCSVVTVTTVGYGDLTVDTDAMRLFTCGYILVGVGVLGTALGEVISSLLNTDSTPAGGRRQPPDFALCPGPKVPLHTFYLSIT